MLARMHVWKVHESSSTYNAYHTVATYRIDTPAVKTHVLIAVHFNISLEVGMRVFLLSAQKLEGWCYGHRIEVARGRVALSDTPYSGSRRRKQAKVRSCPQGFHK